MVLFQGAPNCVSTGVGISPMDPTVFESVYIYKADGVDVGKVASAATIYPKSLSSFPTFEVASGGQMTIHKAVGVSSKLLFKKGAAADKVVMTNYRDFETITSTDSGSGTAVFYARTALAIEEDDFALTHIGIESAIPASATNRFINHTGGADSHHTGDFYIHSGLYADTVNADYGNFYQRIKLNQRELKLGSDGFLYAWDPTRSKFLATSSETIVFGRNTALTSNTMLGHAGNVTGGFGTAFDFHRDVTVIAVTAMADSVTGTATDIDLRTGVANSTSTTVSASYTVPIETRPSDLYEGINIDLDKETRMTAEVMAGDSGGTITDPILQVEFKWRLE